MSIHSKQELRRQILDLIKNQKEEDALRKSRLIAEKLFALPVFVRAKTILFYASFKGEVDTFAMMNRAIELHKCVALPVVQKATKRIIPMRIASLENLKPGTYGIPEPEDSPSRAVLLSHIDMVIVPGLAFDRANHRLGRGAGFYDRFLSELPSSIPTFGLAYDFQVVDAIPEKASHDRPVACVLTN